MHTVEAIIPVYNQAVDSILNMLAILKHFLVMSFVRMGDNLRGLRLTLIPIDLAVV